MFVEEITPVILGSAVVVLTIVVGINIMVNAVSSHRIKKAYKKIEEIEKRVEMYIDEVTKNEEIIMENEVAQAENSLISQVLEEIFP